MGCKGCKERRLRAKSKIEREQVRRDYVIKLEELFTYFGILFNDCIMCGTAEDLCCQRVSPDTNLKYDPGNRYSICFTCLYKLDSADFLLRTEEKLRYIEKYREETVDYKDFDVLRDLELAIRRNKPYREIKI
jgi:hypothetical protein